MDWDKLKIFHAVAEAGSFTNATINLNLSQSAISRQIQSLEQDLKVQLFERHARGLTLTENGEYVFKTAHEVIAKLKEVETSLGDQKNKPTGKLTITTVRSFGTHWLTPRIQELEFAREKDGYTSVKHQREVGTSYFDAVSNTISSGKSSTTAMEGSTESEQF